MSALRSRTLRLLPLAALLICGAILITACGGDDDYETAETHDAHEADDAAPADLTTGELSEAALAGEKLFSANCSACHGATANGTNQGPPLVHQIYEPSHHGNASFVIAVARGVRAHHWDFGNMPAVESLSIDEIHQVICYVRELQLASGIIEEIPTSTPC